MDDCIRTGVSSAEEKLPGRLGLRRRAPLLYRRLMRGYLPLPHHFRTPAELTFLLLFHRFYPGLATPTLPAIDGRPLPAGNIAAPEAFRTPNPNDVVLDLNDDATDAVRVGPVEAIPAPDLGGTGGGPTPRADSFE